MKMTEKHTFLIGLNDAAPLWAPVISCGDVRCQRRDGMFLQSGWGN